MVGIDFDEQDITIVSSVSSALMMRMAKAPHMSGHLSELPSITINMAIDWLTQMKVLQSRVLAQTEAKKVTKQ